MIDDKFILNHGFPGSLLPPQASKEIDESIVRMSLGNFLFRFHFIVYCYCSATRIFNRGSGDMELDAALALRADIKEFQALLTRFLAGSYMFCFMCFI